MKLIRNINNNVSICIDDLGREVIVFGKGIGFMKPPNKVDTKKIEKIFYNIDDMNSEVLKDINPKIINCAVQIINMAEKDLNFQFMPTAVIALADHIKFAVERKKNKIQLNIEFKQQVLFKNPEILPELPKILEIIQTETGVELEKNEAKIIACHLIDNKVDSGEDQFNLSYDFKKECLDIINTIFRKTLDEDSYNYTRFVIHLEYLVSRIINRKQIENYNNQIYFSMKNNYTQSSECVDKLDQVFKERLDVSLSNEEKLYLLIHINRGWLENNDEEGV